MISKNALSSELVWNGAQSPNLDQLCSVNADMLDCDGHVPIPCLDQKFETFHIHPEMASMNGWNMALRNAVHVKRFLGI